MSKLAKKFITGIFTILIFTLALSIFVNTKIVEKYYLYQQRKSIASIANDLEGQLRLEKDPAAIISEIEKKENVLITFSSQTSDMDALNNDLREKFREKGLGFQKFWLWDKDYTTALESGKKRRIYHQDKLNYGILVEYLSYKDQLFAIASIVPNTQELVSIINKFLIALQMFSLLTALALIFILVRHITNPLKRIEEFSKKISRQEYEPLSLKTGDELETVAESMNQMGKSIQDYQHKLLYKNRQMEQLLDNVAHDLKTPISLIKMYAQGMKDGLDDGTFLDVMIKQNSRMEQMTEQLLHLSRISQKEYHKEELSLDSLLLQHLEELKILADSRGLAIHASILSNAIVTGNPVLIGTLFSNLLSNAFKYAAGNSVRVVLERCGASYAFTASNELGQITPDPDRIWEPFYVGEESRNQALSGTGLGLAIVKKLAQQAGYSIHCEIKEGWIHFKLTF